MKRVTSLGFLLGCCSLCLAQDTLADRKLEGIIVSVNKWQQNSNEVPNRITRITQQSILHYSPQTSADMLAQTGTVFVQKSQLGGGSPMIRGFATNRVLLVVDGVRMNNAIYRSGNLQNVISIDPLSLQSTEVIFGPGSLIYGSDAIGGVMDFHTLQPRFAPGKKLLVTGNAYARFASANNENTVHADINAGTGRLSVLASYTHSKFDDLRMGANGPTENYLRPEYVKRVNNRDSIFKNPDERTQRFTGYQQDNFLGKIRWKASSSLDLQYAFTYAETGDAPRYDRLIQYRNGALRFAEWQYGPMRWRMHTINAMLTKKNSLADNIRIVAGYQAYEESRIDRPRGSAIRTKQAEEVNAWNVNLDARKKIGKGELFYGAETVYNRVGSTGYQSNISNGTVRPFASRYPNGSTWSTTGVYGSYKWNPSLQTTVTGGVRYSFNALNAAFDTTFVSFPYRNANLNDGAFTGNFGLTFRPVDTWQLNANIATGYRMPNIDDMGKLFESSPGNVTVPNPDLQAEKALNFEAGLVKNSVNKLKVELTGFYSILSDAIVRRPFAFNGQDSLEFMGVRSRVEALQNVARATVWGLQASARIYFITSLYLQTHTNWIWGRETDDVKNEQVPLRHAPPFYGSTHLHYQTDKVHAEVYTFYNSEVSYESLAPSEQAKPDIYARDEMGRPFSPGWHTFNARISYQWLKNMMLTAGWENITGRRYRPYSSGLVAAGSNVAVSLRASL